MNKKVINRTGWKILASNALLQACSMVCILFAYYCFTDLGKVDMAYVTVTMLIVNIVACVWSFSFGAFMQKTRSRFGQYRPWAVISCVVVLVGSFLMMVKTDNQLVTCVIIGAGYLLATMAMDPSNTASYGIIEKLSEGNSEARNTFSSMNFAGGNLGYIVYSFVFMYLVMFLGGESEIVGFRWTQLILSVVALLGVWVLVSISRKADGDNRVAAAGTGDEEMMEQVGFGKMVKSIVTNRYMLGTFISSILRFCGYMVFCSMILYHCVSVIGNPLLFSGLMSALSIAGLLGCLIAPKLVKLTGGRKSSQVTFIILAGILYIAMGFLGQSVVWLYITVLAATFFQNIADAVNPMVYLDAGELWYNKTGEDTRSYSMSMQMFAAKLGNIVASPIMGWILISLNYSEGVALDTAGKYSMSLYTGAIPGVLFILGGIVFPLFFNIKFKDVEKAIAENAAKDGYSMYEQM